MSATIKLKSGITNPPDNILQQRELGVNTSTDELFIGTSSGRAKQIASVPYVQMLLMGYVNSSEILPKYLNLYADLQSFKQKKIQYLFIYTQKQVKPKYRVLLNTKMQVQFPLRQTI